MLLVKTYLDKSNVHGIGLFTAEDIIQGQKVWTFTPDFDQKFTSEQYNALPEGARDFIDRYGYHDNEYYYLDSDRCKFMNHSETPNLNFKKDNLDNTIDMYAIKDIPANTEILCNYFDVDNGTCSARFI